MDAAAGGEKKEKKEESVADKVAALSIFRDAGQLFVDNSRFFALERAGRRGETLDVLAATEAFSAPTPREPRAASLLAMARALPDLYADKDRGPLSNLSGPYTLKDVRDDVEAAAADLAAADVHDVSCHAPSKS